MLTLIHVNSSFLICSNIICLNIKIRINKTPTRHGITEGSGGAITRLAIREAKVPSLATITPSANHIRTAEALASEFLTLKAFRTIEVTLAGQSSIVIIHCQLEGSFLTKS